MCRVCRCSRDESQIHNVHTETCISFQGLILMSQYIVFIYFLQIFCLYLYVGLL